ncbi:three-Cys-motif partner protein TcmP [uncultured Phascolarctobacterium sp.]|uniref:three-Cys-motif partner protein TcmP n=1 Tax=uncultured Phascolarctobacterium sp. TaxID=512296 RepID=UPI0027D971F9|nr:three-Cys-motif partner protein TcmP [uncultured Phascolarctobacterium sp.]
MVSANNKKTISKASPHTIKKFELIETYIKSWAQILMQNEKCNGLIFIDCMCNSGIYQDDYGNLVEGTPIRVAKALRDVARRYEDKQIFLYLNDNDAMKINELRKHLPDDERNISTITLIGDANNLLERIGPRLTPEGHFNYFLLYDPYNASIDWNALLPFFGNWGEVMINHAVLDPVRAIFSAKKKAAIKKYENTYLTDFEKLVPFGSDKNAYEARVEEIIKLLKGNRRYYVAAFPFYNSQNSQMYNLIHCTSNKAGFVLYKNCAWKVFGGKSSAKRGTENSYQLALDENGNITVPTDESCFYIKDIAKYLYDSFKKQKNVRLEQMWKLLEEHPVFPSEGFKKEIKKELFEVYGVSKKQIINTNTGKKEIVLSFL